MDQHTCTACNKPFETADALAMHNAAKHPQPLTKPRISRQQKRRIVWGIVAVAAVAGMLLLGWGILKAQQDYKSAPAKEINIGGHKNLQLHIHANLRIVIDGEAQPIPASVGISRSVMRPLHTHDASGELHIEGPTPRDFTLGEFFDIWGRTFSSSCILDYCTDRGTLTMTINGKESTAFGSHVLRDDDQIVIEYTSLGQAPAAGEESNQ